MCVWVLGLTHLILIIAFFFFMSSNYDPVLAVVKIVEQNKRLISHDNNVSRFQLK